MRGPVRPSVCPSKVMAVFEGEVINDINNDNDTLSEDEAGAPDVRP